MSSKSNGRGAGRFAAMFALGAMLNALIAGNAFAQAKGKDSLQARLRQVEDRQAIEQRLMGDYPRALDAFNWKAYAANCGKEQELDRDRPSHERHWVGIIASRIDGGIFRPLY